MRELTGDIFEQLGVVDALCIPTNCSVMTDEDGNCPTNPMGALAGQFASRWPDLPFIYGRLLLRTPNVPIVLGFVPIDDLANMVEDMEDGPDYTAIVAFPTMTEIGVPAELGLVERSAELLAEMADLFSWKTVMLPEVGCGVGGLDFKTEVQPLLDEILDDRFTCVHYKLKHTGFVKFGDEKKGSELLRLREDNDDGEENSL